MNKLLLATIAALAVSFAPLGEYGFGDLFLDGSETKSFAKQKGNHISCQTLVNSGGFSGPPIPAFKVGFYLSGDTTISITDKLIGTYTVYPISGSFVTYTASITNVDLTPLGVTNGTYYIGTILDIENTVAENGMTPEFENNSWAYRNAQGVMKIVNYPGSDVGLSENKKTTFYNVSRTAETITYSSATSEKISVQLFSIDGRLLASETGHSVSIPVTNQACLLKISDGTSEQNLKAVH